ncbi:MAG: B12-binding domain-containing radical SAM protein [Actinobacteria bacterium]|nr:B12-binding domain-containing radical SAM protein [Actinomycetota bacterium]
MLLYLVNPSNPLVSMSLNRGTYLSRFRLWKPLGLQVLAGLTPADWEISILDENLGPIDYETLPRPDVVGITAFTSQAPRAYKIAERFRVHGIPVVMGGIHATMCLSEADRYVDSVVTGEAETVWAEVLDDVRSGSLKPRYDGGQAGMDQIVSARHDLLPRGYAFGSIQTTRGCSLNCTFCSVTRFNGSRYRQRPIPEVVDEFRSIPETRVLIVDDNLIGRRPQHIERAKELFRAMAAANTGKSWVGQTTINIADDEELLALAQEAGCVGLFIGFESVTPEGLPELGRKSAMLSGRNIRAAVERIHEHGMLVVGSFIIGLDSDRPGVGPLIAGEAERYGVDNINVLFLTPLPGTRLWTELKTEGRIAMNDFPEDWQYYTLNYPVARYKYLSADRIVREMTECNRAFYSSRNILARLGRNLWAGRNPLLGLVSNLTSRRNSQRFAQIYAALWPSADGIEGASPKVRSQLERLGLPIEKLRNGSL